MFASLCVVCVLCIHVDVCGVCVVCHFSVHVLCVNHKVSSYRVSVAYHL